MIFVQLYGVDGRQRLEVVMIFSLRRILIGKRVHVR